MDRNREARRGAAAAAASGMVTTSNGLSRRRHRSSSSSLRDSPDEDGGVELQESIRLRDRAKKERDLRDRERDRERERERERAISSSSRSKRRRAAERLLMHHNNNNSSRGDDVVGVGVGVGVGDDSSEESVNDDEDDEDEDNHNHHTAHNSSNGSLGGGGGGVRLLPPSGSMPNHFHNNHNHLQHRKSFPPSGNTTATSTTTSKAFRAAPVWKSGDEMIGVSVPRKARSAATKRSHDWISSGNGVGGNSGAVVGEQINRQASTSPVQQSLVPASTMSPVPPLSPSSSNVSVRKKLKPNNNGLKPRPPKSSSKSSSNPEELEIEIAEVLYGLMTQTQGPSKKEVASNDSKEANHRSNSDAKSPVSGSNITQQTPVLAQNSSSSAGPLSTVAPKRKRPRQVSDSLGNSSARSSPISSTRTEIDQSLKTEVSVAVSTSSTSLTPGSASVPVENGGVSNDLGGLVNSQAPPEPMKIDSDSKPVVADELDRRKDSVAARVGDAYGSLKKESPVARTEESNREDAVAAAAAGLVAASVNKDFTEAEMDGHREEKFQIDLMAPPPQMRSSPDSERELDVGAPVEDQKPIVSRVDAVMRSEEEKAGKTGNDVVNVRAEEKTAKPVLEETESKKGVENKGRNIDLQLDLEKPERDNGMAGNKLHGGGQKQQLLPPAVKVIKEEPHAEKAGQSSSFPLPMSMASWPGGLPPMGYMAPLQGVVSMEGNTVPSAPIQMPLFSQPRPKKCATHWYVARNIQNMQQLMKINPFWPAAAGSAALFGSKACNVNIVPSADLHASIAGRGVSTVQDKGQGLAIFPGHSGKDKGSQPANTADAGQRKQQILLQPTLPPVAPNNILQGPTFIFPLNQQQAAMAAAAARPGSAKSPALTAGGASSSATTAAAVSSSGTVAVPPNAMSFSYPTMPTNEAQYLAILQNNGYPFPIPAVGANPNYRGPHPQPLPLFNGSFYSSQMIHPSQLQQQPPTASQSQQVQQSHQNTSMSSGSSSTQKHLQSQQQRPQGSAVSGGSGSGNSQNFSAKNRTTQQPQQPANQHGPKPQVHLENEVGGEDSRSNHDTRGTRAPISIYGQNFAMPMHTPNFALITPPTTLAGVPASSGSGHQSDKRQQQLPQPGMKTGMDSLPPQTFAMSFGPINGATTPGIDLSSMAQNHAIFQNFSEAGRPNIQMMAAAAASQAGQPKKNFRISDDVKIGGGGGESSNSADDERRVLAGRAQASVGQSIAFSRSDVADMSASANNVVESSARNLNLSSGSARNCRTPMPNTMGAVSVQNAQLQAQLHQQHQQFMELHKQQQQQQQHQQQQQQQQHQQQQQQQQLPARSKTPATSNGSVFSEHLAPSSSIANKFPNAMSAFPQNLVQTSNGSPAQSPQWKNSARTVTSQNPSSLASSTNSSLKNLPQQSGRTQTHTQISFVSNQKPASGSQGQPPASNQSPSPPMVVGSPTTSSISKGASGSPRTTASASTGNKSGQASSLSTQQGKNSPSAPSQKSSPVGGRNVPSILGNPHVSSNSSSGAKTAVQQLQQQQQQQLLQKNMQQAQLFFSSPYIQAQSQHSPSSAASGNSGYYLQRRRPDQQQSPQQPPGSSAASSTGMLSLCPVTLAGSSTTDPAKALAAAAAASNMKGGGFPSQGVLHTSQISSQSSGNQHPLMPAGFSYVHTVPAAVQAKPTEQKQQAGNDNLHACWQPEKK